MEAWSVKKLGTGECTASGRFSEADERQCSDQSKQWDPLLSIKALVEEPYESCPRLPRGISLLASQNATSLPKYGVRSQCRVDVPYGNLQLLLRGCSMRSRML